MFGFLKRHPETVDDKHLEQVVTDCDQHDKNSAAKKMENYEKNLKLNLEAKRKDLDNITTSIIPFQLTLIRMFLWLSFSSLGAVFYFVKPDRIINVCQAYFLVLISLTVICTAIVCLMAIKESADRPTAHLDNNYFRDHINQDDYEHVKGLMAMLDVTTKALDIAAKSMAKAGKMLRRAIYLSFATLFFIFSLAVVSIYPMKGGENMAEEQKDVKVSTDLTNDTRPAFKSVAEIKPSVLQANNRESINNESWTEGGGYNITSSDQNQTDTATSGDKDKK